MHWVFWVAVAVVVYSYAGYAAWLWLCRYFTHRPIRSGPYAAPISILMVVRNEAAVIERKLKNLFSLSYPSDQMEIIVVSDGSTDHTNEILRRFSRDSRLRLILNDNPRGKAAGLNDAIRIAQGEVLVFMDARQEIERDGVRLLIENFADPEVGCASGELMIGDRSASGGTGGRGIYWKIEKAVRKMESATGSVVGASGAFYAVRRSLIGTLPPETILDDVYIPMQVVRQSARVVLDIRARAWDRDLGPMREFSRKVRTLSGNYQLLRLAPWILTSQNPIRFRFVSHKLARLAVPFALGAALLSSFMLPELLFRGAFLLQLAFYALSACTVVRHKPALLSRISEVAFSFVLLNTAAFMAFVNFATGHVVRWSVAETGSVWGSGSLDLGDVPEAVLTSE